MKSLNTEQSMLESASMIFRRCMVLVVPVFVLFINLTMAGQTRAMMVSPVIYDVTIDPGAESIQEILLKNDSNSSAEYSLSSENFIPFGEEGNQMYLSDSDRSDLASWFAWNADVIRVGAGESVRVPIHIRVPFNASAGGHYASVFISKKSGGSDLSRVGVSEEVGVLFLVRVRGEVLERLSVDSFLLQSSSHSNRLPLHVDLRLQNEGSVHVRPEGNLVVRNLIGKRVAVIPLNPTGKAVLPGSIRHFQMDWKKTEGDSDACSFWNEVRMEWVNFAFGRYTFEVEGVFGDMHQTFSSDRIIVWIIPWHLLTVVFGGVLALFAVMKIYNHCLIRCLIAKSDAKRRTKRRRS